MPRHLLLLLMCFAVAPWASADEPESIDYFIYRVELSTWNGGRELPSLETELGLASYEGSSLVQTARGQGGATRITLVALATVDGVPDNRGSQRKLTENQQFALDAAQRFGFDDLTLRLYAPGAERFEARFYRTFHPGGVAAWTSNARTVEGQHLPEEHFATISGAIDTPELNLSVDLPAMSTPEA